MTRQRGSAPRLSITGSRKPRPICWRLRIGTCLLQVANGEDVRVVPPLDERRMAEMNRSGSSKLSSFCLFCMIRSKRSRHP